MAERELEQQLKPKPAVASAEPAVLERYREMVHNLQHDLKEVQAKNVQLVNEMHEIRIDNGITQAALADSHNMQTRTAFMHVREVEDTPSRTRTLPSKPPSETLLLRRRLSNLCERETTS